MTLPTTRRVSAALAIACIAVACGQTEQPLGDLGQPARGTAGQGSGGSNAAGTAGSGGSAAGSGPGPSSCAAAPDFDCVKDCDQHTMPGMPGCPDGKAWTCNGADMRTDACATDTVAGSCAGKWQSTPSCVDSCAGNIPKSPECDGVGNVVCPAGSIARSACPIDYCASRAICCDENGVQDIPQCDSQTGKFAPCEGPGSRLVVNQCTPTAVQTENCLELEGKSCASDAWVCKVSRCIICNCNPDPKGALAWTCFIGIC